MTQVVEIARSRGDSITESGTYARIVRNALEQVEGENASGDPVSGGNFWRAASVGAAGSYSSSAGRRVLIAKDAAASAQDQHSVRSSMMATYSDDFPPGPHAGDISPRPTRLRPRIALFPESCTEARRLRRNGLSVEDIACELNADEENVRLALAAMRTPRRTPTRASLNVTVAARDFVAAENLDGEATWQTVERLLVELTFRRAMSNQTAH